MFNLAEFINYTYFKEMSSEKTKNTECFLQRESRLLLILDGCDEVAGF